MTTALYLTPCSPERAGMDIDTLDKWRTSTMTRKQAEYVATFCDHCEATKHCKAQGYWYNEDGKRIVLVGIFGGLTEAQR